MTLIRSIFWKMTLKPFLLPPYHPRTKDKGRK